MSFLIENQAIILTVLLSIAEILNLIFPSFRGIAGSLIMALKALGAKKIEDLEQK